MRSAENYYLGCLLYLVFFLIMGDCVSTYLCFITSLPEGIRIWETNPLAQWAFEYWDVVTGLTIIFVVKTVFLGILYKWAQTSSYMHLLFRGTLTVAALISVYVNYNNWSIYYMLLQG